MKTTGVGAALILLAGLSTARRKRSPSAGSAAAALEDKIRGGWAGQMIGVSYGAPTEFRSNGKIIEGQPDKYLDWSPERLRTPSTRTTSTWR